MPVGAEHYLHTTHRTVNWFRKAFEDGELQLTPPYQRQAVWTNLQKSYLIDTILNGLPIPELYMQDTADASGHEEHIIVDGQQRIRAVLDFVTNKYPLEGSEVTKTWSGRYFDQLDEIQKRNIYTYKFVVRILPPELGDSEIRSIFSRINKNVVNLNDQELRNATYSGEFISSIQKMADEDPFWAESGVFTANDHRRMLDHEFISELAVAYLHGLQNKKDKLDQYYTQYEESFEQRPEMEQSFLDITREISRLLPDLAKGRWKKRSDFYTLFTELSSRKERIPFDENELVALRDRINKLGQQVDQVLRLDEEDRGDYDRNVVTYARSVARAASDRGSRVARSYAFSRYVFGEEPRHNLPEPRSETAEMAVEVATTDEEQTSR